MQENISWNLWLARNFVHKIEQRLFYYSNFSSIYKFPIEVNYGILTNAAFPPSQTTICLLCPTHPKQRDIVTMLIQPAFSEEATHP
jgi:hypothetical protein